MSEPVVLSTQPLGFPWVTRDPFLFCVHHDDAYPKAGQDMSPKASLAGRQLGQDFSRKDGWSMYHGQRIPGFPQHPHRGFETVTVVRKGRIDHADSLGATARFGGGDTQWMTAGKGVVHSEMFPLLHQDQDNPLELFQIWLNLPRADKMVDPHFAMLWDVRIPKVRAIDDAGRETLVAVIAGALGDAKAPPPPPRSWAARAEADVAIWTLKLSAGARLTLPAASGDETLRTLYFFVGDAVTIGGTRVASHAAIDVRADAELVIEAGGETCELLMLQGRPIGEPVVAHGPFVMNTVEEIHQTIRDYQRTRFGGWPWQSDDPVHPRSKGRFAIHADGRKEEMEG